MAHQSQHDTKGSDGLEPGPSRHDGLPLQEETVHRLNMGMLLQTAGSMLGLPQQVLLTAAIFMQRFYAKRSRVTFEPEFIVSTCLYLASKLEDFPRRISDVVNVIHRLQHAPAERPIPSAIDKLSGRSKSQSEDTDLPAVLTGKAYYHAKDRLIKYEQSILRAADFKVDIEQPHKYLLLYCRTIRASQALTQLACGALNDCIVYTSLYLRYPPAILAGGALNFAVLLLEVAQDMPPEWWLPLNLDMSLLASIGDELVDMYNNVPAKLVTEEGELE
uniref:Cyclin-like domain-containing protein n=1 Tax=Pyramimonas obovata TaxID=1411642 RepID=A0A7S0N432_9CHLO|mmetsp:Transcript_20233/g.44300  ORF Transcript_20233/g.44300 Transcript_20233/m.44300 type:complete len:275 (+) Transcript_20233:435-1259(+)|eukprot:CAMPEP_0118939332 /NCGR_PEP_ID=MMETSP1169-20130426/28599_1 /TAXON_ID=36882 /ORGANISM="Pyramimonas obovata, Strain CCMP722" /LENGTH=274 /DNA_ID=CAMNT_0006883579 /DNA_START=388 /DNA_END=1212 /DNA_ORIENTATION=-